MKDKMKNWLIRSNRNFDKLELWKLLLLVVFIILTTYVDNQWINGNPVTFASFSILFVVWRMLGIELAKRDKKE